MNRRSFLARAGLLATGGLAGCARVPGGLPPTDAGTSSPPPSGTDPATQTPTPVFTRSRTGTPDATPSPTLRNGSFEHALWGWFVGSDLPTDPNTGGPVETRVSVTGFGGRGRATATSPTATATSTATDTATSTATATATSTSTPTPASIPTPAPTPVPADGRHALALFVDGRQDDGTLWVSQPVELGGVETLSVAVYSEQESFNTVTKVAAYAGPRPGHRLREGDFDTSRAAEDHDGWKSYEYAVDHDGPGTVAVGVSVVWETEVTRFLDDVVLS